MPLLMVLLAAIAGLALLTAVPQAQAASKKSASKKKKLKQMPWTSMHVVGDRKSDRAGTAVAPVGGDWDGDKIPDFVVGAPGVSSSERGSAGGAYIVFSSLFRSLVDLGKLEDDGVFILGAGPGDQAGSSVAPAGDVNGDGVPDVLIGAPGAGPKGRTAGGEAYVVFGGQSGPIDLRSPTLRGFRMEGAAHGDGAGTSVAGIGDVNGDGLADIAVGAPYATRPNPIAGHPPLDSTGSAYVVFGSPSTAPVDLADFGARAYRIDGAEASDWTGYSVAPAGDVNGDSVPDVLVGAPTSGTGDERDEAGAAYLVHGQGAPGAILSMSAIESYGYRIDGAQAGDWTGGSVAPAGDVNGDGRPDLLIGSDRASVGSRDAVGTAHVIFGPPAPRFSLAQIGGLGVRATGPAQGGLIGSVAAGDFNGDGQQDILAGNAFADDGRCKFSTGGAYLIPGRPHAADLDMRNLNHAGLFYEGRKTNDRLGYSVANFGDLHADGRDDLLVGVPLWDRPGRNNAGAAYLFLGRAAGSKLPGQRRGGRVMCGKISTGSMESLRSSGLQMVVGSRRAGKLRIAAVIGAGDRTTATREDIDIDYASSARINLHLTKAGERMLKVRTDRRTGKKGPTRAVIVVVMELRDSSGKRISRQTVRKTVRASLLETFSG